MEKENLKMGPISACYVNILYMKNVLIEQIKSWL